jgi:hypothetical protein
MSGIYEVAVEMGSDDIVPCLINIGSDVQKLMGGGDTQTQREHGDLINLRLSFFQNEESRLQTTQY